MSLFSDSLSSLGKEFENQFALIQGQHRLEMESLRTHIESLGDKLTFVLEQFAVLIKEHMVYQIVQENAAVAAAVAAAIESEPVAAAAIESEPVAAIVVSAAESEPVAAIVVSAAEELEPVAAAEPKEEEEEISLVEKFLKAHDGSGKKKKYYVTDDDMKEIYEALADGEVGEEAIGKMVKHGKTFRAHFFNSATTK